MKQEIIMAGFGGQGVMLMGKILAYAAMESGLQVTWFPSYGPEMRGGTANCTVIIADSRIYSPFSVRPDVVIVMNKPSLEKFVDQVNHGGIIFVNSSLVTADVSRNNLEVIRVAANQIAGELGTARIANMVMLGSYIARKKIVSLDKIKDSLKEVLPARRHDLIPVNKQAIDRGYALIE